MIRTLIINFTNEKQEKIILKENDTYHYENNLLIVSVINSPIKYFSIANIFNFYVEERVTL